MPIRHDCDVCRGSQKIRLPVWPSLSATAIRHEDSAIVTVSHREYPCPECADVTRLERVQAAREETFAASYIKAEGFIEHVKDGLAHQLAGYLLRNGFIRFERGPEDEQEMRFAMRATVGVVRPNQLDNLEERIAERQTEVAQEVVAEAERQINNWGSYYGHRDISKDQAAREVREAFGAVLKKRAEWKAA